MRNRTSSIATIGLAVVAALVLTAASSATAEVSADADATTPFIVKIHADWCGTCTRMNPTFEALDTTLGSQARIVVLDVTDRDAVARSRQEAERLGLGDFFESHLSKTGTAAVLHGATRETVKVMKGETDVSVYQAAVAAAKEG